MPGLIRAIDEATSQVFPWMTRGLAGTRTLRSSSPSRSKAPHWPRSAPRKRSAGRCAVSTACLSFGLQTSQEGIWGGTTREARRALRPRPHAEDRAGR
jgi:hypothetical protein